MGDDDDDDSEELDDELVVEDKELSGERGSTTVAPRQVTVASTSRLVIADAPETNLLNVSVKSF